jgi:hypothetical protein
VRDDVIEHFPALAVFHHQVDVFRRVQHFEQLDDVRVPRFFQNLDLAVHPPDVGLLLDLAFFQDFHGDLFPRGHVGGQFDLAKGPVPKRLPNRKLPDGLGGRSVRE